MKSVSAFIKSNAEKVVLTFLVISAVMIGAINYPPLISLWENSVIYNNFRPDIKPPIVLAIQKGGDSVGFHGIGYAGLIASRYVSDVFGHSLSMVRYVSVMYALITLALFYLITRRWFGWKTAAFSAALLMTNINFIIFEHTLMVQMLTLMLMLFFIERYQNLQKKMSITAAVWLGFACALLSMHNIAGRVYLLAVLFYYIIDSDWTLLKGRTRELKDELKLKGKLLLTALIAMTAFLFLFFPLNLKLLFNKEFIFSSLGEYSTSFMGTVLAAGHNAVYFVKYFMLGALRPNTPLDVMLTVPYPIENLIVSALFIAGSILCLTQIKKQEIRFIYYSVIVLFAASLTSTTYPGLTGVLSTTFGITRVIYMIPFIILLAALGLKVLYDIAAKQTRYAMMLFVIFGSVVLLLRAGTIAGEMKRFAAFMEENMFSASSPAIEKRWDWKSSTWDMPPEEKRKLILNQDYFRGLALYIKTKVKSSGPGPYFIYVPSKYYTPEFYTYGGGDMPYRGHPYYFEMYMTFYLQDLGIYSTYLVKRSDYKNFAGRAISKLGASQKGRKIVSLISGNPLGKQIMGLLEKMSKGYPGEVISDEYFVNDTGWGKPHYILVTDGAQLAAVKKLKGARIVLELPKDANKKKERN